MIPYSLHVALLIVISLLFYKLMLKKETYHKLNRVVLLACLVLAFIMPLVPVPQRFSLMRESAVTSSAIETDTYPQVSTQPLTAPNTVVQKVAVAPQNIDQPKETIADIFTEDNMLKWAFWIYWCGVAIFGVNLLIQLLVVSYKILKSEVIPDGIYRIVELDDDKAPCSFGNYIFINPSKYDWDTYEQILIHEKVHVQQLHTLDLILAEIVTVFQWFNPLAWLYRKEIENNLEFLTDNTVVDRYNVKPDDYQINLLKVCVPNYSMRITTNYNQSLLKQRIMMMNSKRSNIHIVWKYFVIVPLFALLVCLLNKPVAVSAQVAQKVPTDTLKKKSKVVVTDIRLATTQKGKTVKKPGTLVVNNKLAAKNGRTYVVNDKVVVSNVLLDKPVITDRVVASARPTVSNVFLEKEVLTNGLKSGKSDSLITWYIPGGNNYRNFSAQDLIDLQGNGVSMGYIQGIGMAGYKNFSSKDIIDLHASGVSTGYITSISTVGYKNFSSKDIIDLQAAGVNDGYIRGIGLAGYKNFSSKDIIDLQASGVSAGFIKGISAAGYKNFSSKDIIDLQAAGVSADYLKGISSAGYKRFSVYDIIQLHKSGVSVGNGKGQSNK